MDLTVVQPGFHSEDPILAVERLVTLFDTPRGVLRAVDTVDLAIRHGETFGVVGESGSGKTVMALSLMRLIRPPGRIASGEILLEGKPLNALSEREMADVRGPRMGMIFQDPTRRLNPVFTIGTQLAEVFQAHLGWEHRRAWEQAVSLLERVGIPEASARAHAYPYELSGGQAQRVMIALALALGPDLLIADEPTTALDVTIQAQILELMRSLQQERGMAILLITHDMGVIAEMCDRAAVMYAGHFVEQGAIDQIFHDPRHPYTRALLESIPIQTRPGEPLPTIPGVVPDLVDHPPGCRFADRCPARREYGLEICDQVEPELLDFWPGQSVRCWLYQEAPGHSPPRRQDIA
jgi:oligopeptide/dipeptide ABC transporter ATP-binding protein